MKHTPEKLHGTCNAEHWRLTFIVGLAMVCMAVPMIQAGLVRVGIPEPVIVDFGVLAIGERSDHTLRIPNTSADPITIMDVTTSCKCAQVLSYPHRVAPGEVGTIQVRLWPDTKGDVAYEVEVDFKEVLLPNRTYLLIGTVKPGVAGSSSATIPEYLHTEHVARRLVQRKNDLYIEPEHVQQKLASGAAVAVDVRSFKLFAAAHIPGARNIPLFALKTRTSLRSKQVVLVDKGHGAKVLESACRDLRSEGFLSVSILRGGLNGWCRSGGTLVGSARTRASLDTMSAPEFSESRSYGDWLVISVDPVLDKNTEQLVPEAVSMPAPMSTSGLARRIDSELEARAQSMQVQRILILNHDGRGYDAVRKELSRLEEVDVFYLSSGIHGYEEHLQTVSALSRSSTRKLRSAARGSRRKKGCGSCPS